MLVVYCDVAEATNCTSDKNEKYHYAAGINSLLARLLYTQIAFSNFTQEWQMLFNIDKCKVMNMGYNNPWFRNEDVESVREERNLGSHYCG